MISKIIVLSFKSWYKDEMEIQKRIVEMYSIRNRQVR